MTFETENPKIYLFGDFYLTPLSLNDAEDRWKSFNNKEITQFLASPRKDPFTLQDSIELIERGLSSNKEAPFPLNWGIRDANYPDRMIGSIDLHSSDLGLDKEYVPNPELKEKYATVGFYLNPEYHSRGIMSTVLKVLLEEVGFKKLGIKHFFGECFAGNLGSRRTFEKCGFKYVKTIKNGGVKYIPYELKDAEVFELVKR